MVFKLQYSGSPVVTPKPIFNIPSTVQIFENTNTNPKLFLITTALSGLQLVLWSYLSYCAMFDLDPLLERQKYLKALKDSETPTVISETNTSPLEANILPLESNVPPLETNVPLETNIPPLETNEPSLETNEPKQECDDGSELYKWFMSSKWRISLSFISLGAGVMFATVAFIYPLRMVRSVTYVRGTQALQLVTYSPWGSTTTVEVPLVHVVCKTAESQRAPDATIALGIKNYSLNFLLNPNNASIHPMLRSLVLSRQK